MEKIILLVLVTIAKVIGILLAVLVIVALAILFAAVRYCGKISFDDKKAQKRKAEKAAETVQKTQESSKQEKKALSVNLEKSPTAPEQEKQIAPKQTTDQREEQSAFRQADEREKKPRGIRQLFLWLQNVIKIVRKMKKKVHSVQDLVDILRSDAGKAFICIVKENVIHLWKQIHPRRMRGKVIFGTGDPCSTGELLGVLALFYAWYGNGVQIIPDFEQKRIEGNVSFRGRIRMITLICIAWRIIKNKDGRKLLHEWEKWKEEK